MFEFIVCGFITIQAKCTFLYSLIKIFTYIADPDEGKMN